MTPSVKANPRTFRAPFGPPYPLAKSRVVAVGCCVVLWGVGCCGWVVVVMHGGGLAGIGFHGRGT